MSAPSAAILALYARCECYPFYVDGVPVVSTANDDWRTLSRDAGSLGPAGIAIWEGFHAHAWNPRYYPPPTHPAISPDTIGQLSLAV